MDTSLLELDACWLLWSRSNQLDSSERRKTVLAQVNYGFDKFINHRSLSRQSSEPIREDRDIPPYPHQKFHFVPPYFAVSLEVEARKCLEFRCCIKRTVILVYGFHLLTFCSNDVTETVKDNFFFVAINDERRVTILVTYIFLFLFIYKKNLSSARGNSFSLWGEQLRYFANAIIEGYQPNW